MLEINVYRLLLEVLAIVATVLFFLHMEGED
jgi:hypothetical protein